MTIRGELSRRCRRAAEAETPTLFFSGALEELKKMLDSLQALIELPFDVNVTVTAAGAGACRSSSASSCAFASPRGQTSGSNRVGKFYGEFRIDGELEASPSGVRARPAAGRVHR